MGGKQPVCPPAHINLARALRRDVVADASFGPFARAALLGFSLESGPSLLKIVLGQLLAKRRSLASARRALDAVVKSVLAGLGLRSLAVFFGVCLGGSRWLERVLEPVVERFVRRSRSADESSKELSPAERARVKVGTTALSSLVSSLFGIVVYQSNKRRRIPKAASVVNPLPAPTLSNLAVPVQQSNGQSPTLELTLFVLVRACDALVRGAYQSLPGARSRATRWIADQADAIVFTLSCYKIMFSWFYEPHRLPKSYVAWITRLSRMDTRLLELLRHARAGRFAYGKQPDDVVAACSRGIAEHMGVSEDLTQPHITKALPCFIVHGEMATDSCEVNTLKRWLRGFQMSMAIYTPVHAVPKLVFGLSRLRRAPVSALLSILLGAARSSAFLATFIASVYAGVCLGRTRLFPKLFPSISQTRWDGGIAPMLGCWLCGLSVLIENKRRRGEMALYVAPRALYAFLDDVLPHWLSTGPRGQLLARWTERLIFALSTSAITTVAIHRSELNRGFVHGVLSWATGPEWRAERALAKRTKGLDQ